MSHRSKATTITIFVLLTLLIVVMVVFAYSVFVFRPTELHAQATVVAGTFIADQTPQGIFGSVTSRKPTITDSLTVPDNLVQSYDPCIFSNSVLHVVDSSSTQGAVCPLSKTFHDLALQVDMSVVRGDTGGILFSDPSSYRNYIFVVSQRGLFSLHVVQNGEFRLLAETSSARIQQGLYVANVLTFMLRKQHLYLYVNDQFLFQISIAPLPTLNVSFVAPYYPETQADIVFQNVKVWNL